MKKGNLVFFAFLFSVLSIFNSCAFGQNSKKIETIVLTPTADSRLELPSLHADVFDDGSVRLHGKMTLNIHEKEGYYHLSVDVTSETYTAIPFTDIEKSEFLPKLKSNSRFISPLLIDDDSSRSTKSATPLVSYYTATLNLLSEDRVFIDLCKTSGSVSWYDNGATVTATTGVPYFTPYSPTFAFTNWYLQSSYAYFLTPIGTPHFI